MITAYTGTPGSGKSLHKAYFIWDTVLAGKKRIIHNKYIDTSVLARKLGRRKGTERIKERYMYVDDEYLTPDMLIAYALKYHVPGVEGQTVLIVDEAADMFDKDDFKASRYCSKWRKFYRMHRQYGFDIILVVQQLALLDAQIRNCIEREINHRNVKNYQIYGRVLSFLFGGFFSYSQRWVAVKPSLWEKGGAFVLHRRKAKIYRTMEVIADKTQTVKKDKRAKIGTFAEDFADSRKNRRLLPSDQLSNDSSLSLITDLSG